jgi:hypothetical protein
MIYTSMNIPLSIECCEPRLHACPYLPNAEEDVSVVNAPTVPVRPPLGVFEYACVPSVWKRVEAEAWMQADFPSL